MTWDKYFHSICVTVSFKSTCLSRKIGAILVRDNSIVSTGYNGPPRGIPHCGHDRMMKDKQLQHISETQFFRPELIPTSCPRRFLGFASGEGMQWCPAQHAEENAISNAARLGVSTINTTLYMNSIIPCQKCFGTLINAGVVGVVVEQTKLFDSFTQFLIDNSTIKIREFEL